MLKEMRTLHNIHRVVSKFYSLGKYVNEGLTVPERIMLGNLDKMGMLGGLGG